MKEYKKDNKKNQVKDTENDDYIQWHPAFVAAMKLELREYAHDFMVEKKEEGVYYISKKIMFKVQIIVLREVSFDRHPWLKALTRDMGIEQLRRLFSEERKLVTREEKDNAAAVMEVVVKSNKKMFKELGGDEIMGEALMELVRPQVDALLAEKDKEIAEITNQAAEKDNEIRKLKEQIKKLQEQVI